VKLPKGVEENTKYADSVRCFTVTDEDKDIVHLDVSRRGILIRGDSGWVLVTLEQWKFLGGVVERMVSDGE
jgi:hypothetical protein